MDTRSAISKIGDKLVKAMEIREQFNNRPKQVKEDPYTNKVKLLKETLTKEYKFCSENKALHKQYAFKLITINKHIDYVRKIHGQKIFNKMDRELIDKLMEKYGIDNQ
jgi:tRNA 2-selenouridine synthase SelU